MTATVPIPVPTYAGTRLLGEVIAWACPGLSIPHTQVVAALSDAGLDAGVARELAPDTPSAGPASGSVISASSGP